MRNLAFASPINPLPSGISDYSEELLPYLGRYANITLYIDDRLRPSNPLLARHLTIRPISKLARDHRRRPFDAILYQVGNSLAHASIWQALQQTPGVVVLHEYVLHHFMLQYYATVLNDIDRYRLEAGRRYGAEGDRIANLMMHGRFTEAAFELPFSEDVLARADGLIAHSQYVVTHAAAVRPDLPMALVPMGVPLPPASDRAAARMRLGLPAHAPILASFGHINPYKRIDATLRALRILHADYPDLHYILVGSASPSYDVRAAVARAGMLQQVTITGYVERSAFEDYVAAADICINLRHPTAGETSASLLRLLGAGRPTLVTASGSFREVPPGIAAQVDPDASEGDLIQAYIRLLLQRPDLAEQIGNAAHSFVAQQHTLEGAALGYMRFLSKRYGWEEPQPLRPLLWKIEQVEPQAVKPGARSQEPGARSQEPGARSQEPTDPLVTRLGATLAELGATEDDQLLKRAAQVARDLL